MLIDGKKIANEIQADIAKKVEALPNRKPGLAFILVGDNPASQSYVRSKKKACASVGIVSTVIELPAMIAESDLIKQIEQLNQNPEVDGILVQLPLPSHIDEKIVTASIDPSKDVDGFHPINVGKMLLGEEGGFLPCTPHGVQVLLQRSHIPVAGKHVVIVGRSNIVGKPLAAILMQKKPHCNATVTIAHSQSENLHALTRSADVLVAALGRPFFIKKEMIKPGATVIDVGINRLPDGKLVGDVDFQAVSEVAGHITPVPGGIGPMTIAMLLQNTLFSFLKLVLVLFFLASCQKRPPPCTHFGGVAMTMPYQVTIGKQLTDAEQRSVSKTIEKTFGEIHDIESEVSRLNAAATDSLLPLSPPMQNLLSLCQEIVSLSGGRCDSLGWNHISMKNGIFKKDSSATQLDLPIAKGLCVDWIVERLVAMGFPDLLVEWAGEFRAAGHHPENRDWTVQVDPDLKIQNHSIAPIPLRNNALATSGQQRLINPIVAATVIAPTCALADALATAAALFDNRKEVESWAQEVVEIYPEVSFWILSYRKE